MGNLNDRVPYGIGEINENGQIDTLDLKKGAENPSTKVLIWSDVRFIFLPGNGKMKLYLVLGR